MNFFVFLSAVGFVGGVFNTHNEESIAKDVIYILEDLTKSIDVPLIGPLINFIAKSIDPKCVLKSYDNHNMVHLLPSNVKNATHQKSSLLLMVSASCSSKLDVFSEWQFGLVMSTKYLLKAFQESTEFTDMLTCANKYAVENKIINPKRFKFNTNTTVTDKCDKEAKEFLTRFLFKKNEMFGSDCGRKIVKTAEAYLLKYLALNQRKLGKKKMEKERIDYIADARELLENVFLCYKDFLNENVTSSEHTEEYEYD